MDIEKKFARSLTPLTVSTCVDLSLLATKEASGFIYVAYRENDLIIKTGYVKNMEKIKSKEENRNVVIFCKPAKLNELDYMYLTLKDLGYVPLGRSSENSYTYKYSERLKKLIGLLGIPNEQRIVQAKRTKYPLKKSEF
ncbi:hypothetical protein [Prochlorococcus sp. MIT 1341]|uniref:hypothetical protein n=1 Tax=Prochlorococcus sp. MIT 1341 TaxID=3096221 RepID=UPI002A75207E|nr:hypothetical protein [Prochlorococcus sp. MIT 1341]